MTIGPGEVNDACTILRIVGTRMIEKRKPGTADEFARETGLPRREAAALLERLVAAGLVVKRYDYAGATIDSAEDVRRALEGIEA